MPLRNLPRSRVMLDDSHPTILIDAAIAPKLVILGSPSIGSFGCIEGISHTYAVDRLLGNAADAFGCRLAGCLQYGGADVNDVLVLTSNLALRQRAFACRRRAIDGNDEPHYGLCPTKVAPRLCMRGMKSG